MISKFTRFGAVVTGLASSRPILPADVAPPVPALLGIGAVGLVVIGLFIVAVVLISVWVLRRIRQDSSSDQDE